MKIFIGDFGIILLSFALSIVRTFVILTFIPLFSFKQVKARLIKVAISAAIGVPIFFEIYDNLYGKNLHITSTSFLILKEVALAAVIGYVLAMPFWIFQSVGALIDNQRGALSAGYLNPASGPDASMLGDLLSKVVVIVLLLHGVFPYLFSFIYLSHNLWPVLEPMPKFQSMAWQELIMLFNNLVRQFVLYAGPVVLVLLLVEAAFAMLGAYSPQLQVYFMAMPAKGISALIIVFFYFTFLVEHMINEAHHYFDLTSVFISIFEISHE